MNKYLNYMWVGAPLLLLSVGASAATFDELLRDFGTASELSNDKWEQIKGYATSNCNTAKIDQNEYATRIPQPTRNFSQEVRVKDDGLRRSLVFEIKQDQTVVEYVECSIDPATADADVSFGPQTRSKANFQNMKPVAGSYLHGGSQVVTCNQDETQTDALIIKCSHTHNLTLPSTIDLTARGDLMGEVQRYLDRDDLKIVVGNKTLVEIRSLKVTASHDGTYLLNGEFYLKSQQSPAPYKFQERYQFGAVPFKSIDGNFQLSLGQDGHSSNFGRERIWVSNEGLGEAGARAAGYQGLQDSHIAGIFNEIIAPYLKNFMMTEQVPVSQ